MLVKGPAKFNSISSLASNTGECFPVFEARIDRLRFLPALTHPIQFFACTCVSLCFWDTARIGGLGSSNRKRTGRGVLHGV